MTRLIDTAGLPALTAARRAGQDVAAAFPDRIEMGDRARRFLQTLPDPATPRPAPGVGTDQADDVRAAWLTHLAKLRTAYSSGYADGRQHWAQPAAA
ncbi:hypothetical protein [Euzebya sp.]|uniref:hypothetical protein n=1 Tax=Euzebya sp. TaxID=1971409 RepID=UPI0035146CCF